MRVLVCALLVALAVAASSSDSIEDIDDLFIKPNPPKSDCKTNDDCQAPKICKEIKIFGKKINRCTSPPPAAPKKCSSDSDCQSPKVCKSLKLGLKTIKLCVAPKPAPKLPGNNKCKTNADCTAPRVCRKIGPTSICLAPLPMPKDKCSADSDCSAPKKCVEIPFPGGKKIKVCKVPGPKPLPKCQSNADCQPPRVCKQVGPIKLCAGPSPSPPKPQGCSSSSSCTKPKICKEIMFMGKKIKACVMPPKPAPKKCKTNADCPSPKVCKKLRLGFKKVKICVTPPPPCPSSSGPRTKPCSTRCKCGAGQGPCSGKRTCKKGLKCANKKCVPAAAAATPATTLAATAAPFYDDDDDDSSSNEIIADATEDDDFMYAADLEQRAYQFGEDPVDLKKKKHKKCKSDDDCTKPMICRKTKKKGKKRCALPCPKAKGPRTAPCTKLCKCGSGQGPCTSSKTCRGQLKCVNKVCKPKPGPATTAVPASSVAPPASTSGATTAPFYQDAAENAECDFDGDCTDGLTCVDVPAIGKRCVDSGAHGFETFDADLDSDSDVEDDLAF